MYTTLRFKNGIYADILNDEVIAWCYEIDGTQQNVCRKQYKNDDELVEVLDCIRRFLHKDKHTEVFMVLFSLFTKEGDSIKYAEDGSLNITIDKSRSFSEFDDIITRLSHIDSVRIGDINFDEWPEVRPLYHFGREVARIIY